MRKPKKERKQPKHKENGQKKKKREKIKYWLGLLVGLSMCSSTGREKYDSIAPSSTILAWFSLLYNKMTCQCDDSEGQGNHSPLHDCFANNFPPLDGYKRDSHRCYQGSEKEEGIPGERRKVAWVTVKKRFQVY